MYFSELVDYLVDNNINHNFNAKTADLVSMQVGGTAKLVVFPKETLQLIEIFKILDNNKFILIGNGTNCYFTDNYLDCPIISTKYINRTSVFENTINAECGCSVNSVCKIALNNNLSGLEFAYGIPGSIGGAVYMNASAFGGMFSNVVINSMVYDKERKSVYTITKDSHAFSHKSSIFQSRDLYVLNTTMQLKACNNDLIKQKMREYLKKRISTQPLDMPNAGSVFIKPKEAFASLLIDKLGLKGYSIGGAQISTKHAGFIVNTGNASANDINALVLYIKSKVKKEYNIDLKEEIILLN